ncbi:MAG: nitroreductase family protein [Nitrososphaeria archaeon]|nr:nitroreductase family protein [Nitrosopumilaceae archaeon]NIP09266.1 nitroreductase family protein [Nitrosopumilaceae archaeon]NIP91140.1 nitroreductase family protein [Nitrososphaeria archaeon]NIS94434.1 nitroreductase family protein [Nitrosopumilaceae archaeon]
MTDDISSFSSETFDAIEKRRAVKHFDEKHQFTDKEIERLVSLAILSPTSFNIQNWRFLVVKDLKLREKIRQVAWNQAQVTDSSLLLVICADLKAWEKEPDRYWKNASKEVQDFLVPAIGNFYQGNEQLQRDEALRSVGIAAQTLMLAAKSAGYDSCPMIGFDSQKVAELISLPKDYIIGMMLAVGKAKSPANPRGGQLGLDQVVFTDTF